MSNYTVKYGHLDKMPYVQPGNKVNQGSLIGKMGNTGKSYGAHLHIDLIEGHRHTLWRLADIHPSREHAEQTGYFIDKFLFNTDVLITSYYCDPRYMREHDGTFVLHPAYDVVPKNKDEAFYNIYWNRSKEGTVVKTGKDAGYGYYCLITYNS